MAGSIAIFFQQKFIARENSLKKTEVMFLARDYSKTQKAKLQTKVFFLEIESYIFSKPPNGFLHRYIKIQLSKENFPIIVLSDSLDPETDDANTYDLSRVSNTFFRKCTDLATVIKMSFYNFPTAGSYSLFLQSFSHFRYESWKCYQ